MFQFSPSPMSYITFWILSNTPGWIVSAATQVDMLSTVTLCFKSFQRKIQQDDGTKPNATRRTRWKCPTTWLRERRETRWRKFAEETLSLSMPLLSLANIRTTLHHLPLIIGFIHRIYSEGYTMPIFFWLQHQKEHKKITHSLPLGGKRKPYTWLDRI